MLQGKLIKLIPLSSEFNDFMLTLLNDQEVAYLEGKVEFPKSLDEQKKWMESYSLNKNSKSFIIQTENNENVGYISFKYLNEISRNGHVAIKLSKEYWGKGLASDALKTLMKFLFTHMNMHRLSSHIIEYNKASQKLFIEKCGWKKEGIARESVYINGAYYDNILIGILREEFLSSEKDPFYNPLYKQFEVKS